MPLFEFNCQRCQHRFEHIASATDTAQNPHYGRCPKCGKNDRAEKLISRFAVGGQGDLRESTVHGCHDHFDGVTEHSHADHSDGSDSE